MINISMKLLFVLIFLNNLIVKMQVGKRYLLFFKALKETLECRQFEMG